MNHIFSKTADYNLVILKEETEGNSKNKNETVKYVNFEILQRLSTQQVDDCLLALSKIYQSLREKI